MGRKASVVACARRSEGVNLSVPSLLQVQRTPGLLLNVLKRTAAVWRFTCLKARFAVRGSKRTTLVFGQV